MLRQSSIEALALDAGGLSDFSDSLGLGEMTQRDEQDTGLALILQGSLEVFCGKIQSLCEAVE